MNFLQKHKNRPWPSHEMRNIPRWYPESCKAMKGFLFKKYIVKVYFHHASPNRDPGYCILFGDRVGASLRLTLLSKSIGEKNRRLDCEFGSSHKLFYDIFMLSRCFLPIAFFERLTLRWFRSKWRRKMLCQTHPCANCAFYVSQIWKKLLSSTTLHTVV